MPAYNKLRAFLFRFYDKICIDDASIVLANKAERALSSPEPSLSTTIVV